MLGRDLLILGSVQVATEIVLYCYRALVNRRSWRRIKGDDRISALPDDLLVKILSLLPTEKAVATSILSKQWRCVWTKLPRLVYSDFVRPIQDEIVWKKLPRIVYPTSVLPFKQESLCWYLNKSLTLHKGTDLYLLIEIGPRCPYYVEVGELIAHELYRVHRLVVKLSWLSGPFTLPNSLYISDKLVHLALLDKIVVDVPCSVSLPNLKTLVLVCVDYKDEDSLVRLLSGCRILEELVLRRHSQDNLKNIIVIKVPSLKSLSYTYILDPSSLGQGNMEGSLVIDSPALKKLFIVDVCSGSSCLIENKPRLDKASINIAQYLDYDFRRSLSSVMFLELLLNLKTVSCCNSIRFSQLIECIIICPSEFDWLEPVMSFLQNSPKLRVLQINQCQSSTNSKLKNFQVSFKQPSSVPRCLAKHLEIFEWKEYQGRKGEKEVIRYILANAMCLKRAGISITKHKDKKTMMEELETMSRVSTSSQLLFSTHFKFMVSPYSE